MSVTSSLAHTRAWPWVPTSVTQGELRGLPTLKMDVKLTEATCARGPGPSPRGPQPPPHTLRIEWELSYSEKDHGSAVGKVDINSLNAHDHVPMHLKICLHIKHLCNSLHQDTKAQWVHSRAQGAAGSQDHSSMMELGPARARAVPAEEGTERFVFAKERRRREISTHKSSPTEKQSSQCIPFLLLCEHIKPLSQNKQLEYK